jgi:ribosomal protein S18 acetylase RimI-like enzyme
MIWRPMGAADLSRVNEIANTVHLDYPEAPEVFGERLKLYPRGCLVLRDSNGTIGGYAVSHPWHYAKPPALDSMLEAIPPMPTTYYLHDVAILPEGRGLGAAQRLMTTLYGIADGLPNMSLVAVNNSKPFWLRHGFSVVEREELKPKLASYGADTFYMARPL